MTMMKKSKVLMIAIGLLIPGYGFAQDAMEGKLISNQVGKISSVITGERSVRVVEILVRTGDRVKKGDIVAKLSTEQLRADREVAMRFVEEAKALVGVAESTSAGAKLIFDRQSGLKNSTSFRRADFEDAEIALQRAESSLKSAQATASRRQAEVDRLDLEIELSTIRAPFDGVVTKVLTNIGATVTQSSPAIAEMLNINLAEIELEVPSNKLSKFEIGTELSYSIKNDERYPAKVRTILPTLDKEKEVRLVRLELNTDKGPSNYVDQQTVKVYLNN